GVLLQSSAVAPSLTIPGKQVFRISPFQGIFFKIFGRKSYFQEFSYMRRRWLIGICITALSFFMRKAIAQDRYIDSLQSKLTSRQLPDTDRVDIMLALGDRLGYSDGVLARKYLDSAYTIAVRENLYLKMGDALSAMAQASYRSNNLDTALILLRQADTVYGRADPNTAKGALISSKMNIATVLRSMGDFSTAITM